MRVYQFRHVGKPGDTIKLHIFAIGKYPPVDTLMALDRQFPAALLQDIHNRLLLLDTSAADAYIGKHRSCQRGKRRPLSETKGFSEGVWIIDTEVMLQFPKPGKGFALYPPNPADSHVSRNIRLLETQQGLKPGETLHAM